MPLVDANLASVWDGGPTSSYRAYKDDVAVGYARSVMSVFYGTDVEALIAALESKGLTKSDRVVLLGAGFGYAHERFLAAGYGPSADGTANGKLCSVDTSTWIQANKGANAVVNILNADVNASTGRRTIRQQFGSNNAVVDWIVTEDVLPWLIDVECGILGTALRGLAANIAHWVSVGTLSSMPGYNWKTAQQWKTLMSPDWVIQRGTAEVL